MFCCRAATLASEAISRKFAVGCTNVSQQNLKDSEHDRCDRTGAQWQFNLPEFEFEVVYGVDVKLEEEQALSRLPTALVNDSQLEDDVPVVKMTTAQLENGNIEAGLKTAYSQS